MTHIVIHCNTVKYGVLSMQEWTLTGGPLKKQKKTDELEPLKPRSVRMPDSLWVKYETEAARQERDAAFLIRKAMQFYIDAGFGKVKK